MQRLSILFYLAILGIPVVAILVYCLVDSPPPPERRMITGYLTIEAMAFSPDGKYLLTGYRLSDLVIPAVVGGGFAQVKAQGDKFLALWDVEAGQEIREFRGHTEMVTSVAILPDGKRAVSASLDDTIRLWDIATGTKIWQVTPYDTKHFLPISIALSLTGKEVFSRGADRAANGDHVVYVKVWDVNTGRLLRIIDPKGKPLNSFSLSPRGSVMVAGNRGCLNLWRLDSDFDVQHLNAHCSWKWAGDFSRNGNHLLTQRRHRLGSQLRVDLVIWDLETGAELKVFERYTADVNAAYFTPDGKHILCAAGRNLLNLWEVDSGKEVWWQLCSVKRLVLSPAGKVAATVPVSADRPTFDLWDIATGKHLRKVQGYD